MISFHNIGFAAGKKSGDLNRPPANIRRRPYLMMTPAMVLTIGILVPFAIAIFLSLTNFSFRMPNWTFVGLNNWINMFSSKAFWHSVGVTFIYAFSATAVELILGLGIALLLNSIENTFTRILKVVLIFPLMVAPVIATIIWQLMTNNSVGILEHFLNAFGVYNFPWAASHSTAMFTAVLIDVWVNTPFMMVLILAGLQSLPKSPFESAQIDGGSAWFTFRNLTLPMLQPFVLVALLFRLMAALQEFGIIFALTKGGPGDTLMNLSLTAYNTGFQFQKLGASLPYILFLWIIINFAARFLVNQWQKSQKTASGNADS